MVVTNDNGPCRERAGCASARRQGDALAAAKKAWAGKYAAELLEIIDWTMQLDHLKRPQSVLALQKALLGETPNRRTG